MHKFILIFCISFLSNLSAEVSFNLDIRPLLSDRCFACHGPDGGEFGEKWKGGLRLDTEEGAFGDLKALKYKVQTAKRVAKGLKPKNPPTTKRYAIVRGKVDLSSLIERIMTDDEDDIMPPVDSHLKLTLAEKNLIKQWIAEGAKWDKHWSFVTPKKASLPKVIQKNWAITPVDNFVLGKLESKKIKPAPAANKTTWLRRVTQDLTGLPPTLPQINAFLKDKSPHSYKKVVDRLLKSTDYAERMTNIWLDNARYADSNGYQFDNARTMWPWRDWVIKAYGDNKPYSEFVTEQLAGDLLPKPSKDQLIATGFNRNHGYSIEGGIIDEEYRTTYASDKAITAGTLFMGLTMECTSCHDHKYDPLTMKDYYSFYAFFNNSSEKGAPGESGRKKKAAAPYINVASLPKSKPIYAMIMKEKIRQSFILNQGLFDKPGKLVQPETPEVLSTFKGYAPNRLGLSKWLVAPENPLFARVAVNRLWQQFFGIGLVKSADNFGMQGDLPTHPRLLDWLSVDFRENGWDMHHLIRNIVLSATYRQSSVFRPKLEDPENRLLARGASFRLPAELIRDQALAVSGLLSRKVGGPSVFPYQPKGVWEDLNAPRSHAEIYKQSSGESLYRKSIYTFWRRAVLHPGMAAFDAPNRNICVVSRESTSTPLQALVTLHGPTYVEASRILAEKYVGKHAAVKLVFQTILSRLPTISEVSLLSDFHAARLKHYKKNPLAAAKLLEVGAKPANKSLPAAQVAALADVCLAVLNLSETLTRK